MRNKYDETDKKNGMWLLKLWKHFFLPAVWEQGAIIISIIFACKVLERSSSAQSMCMCHSILQTSTLTLPLGTDTTLPIQLLDYLFTSLVFSFLLQFPFSGYQPTLRDAFSWGIMQLSFWGENEEEAIYKKVMAENLPEMMKTYKSTNIGSKVYHSKAIFIKRRMKTFFQQENFCNIIRKNFAKVTSK